MSGESVRAGGLRLREFDRRDVDLVRSAGTDPYIVDTTTIPYRPSPREAVDFIDLQRRRARDGVGHVFAVARESDDAALGHVFLGMEELDEGRAPVGYWVGPEHRRQGVAAQALALLLAWSDAELRVPRLYCAIEATNTASMRVAESNGFEREGLMRSWVEIAGRRRDMWLCSRVSAARTR